MIRHSAIIVNIRDETRTLHEGGTVRIAVIGSGISGLACARYLHREHEIHVFEASRHIGGHTATVDVALGGRRYAVDTGFIVYNDRNYPNFIALLEELGVPSRPTVMSFSVSDRTNGLEYAGSNLNTLFAQRKNLFSPRFLNMLRDILRFNREAAADLECGRIDDGTTLGEYLERRRYGRAFIDQYLVPMGAAIWSADTAAMRDFPLRFFVRFFYNHGLLSLKNRPRWRVVEGGSREYIAPLTRGFARRIRVDTPVAGVRRTAAGVRVHLSGDRIAHFDQVVFACHGDQALALLRDPTEAEKAVLGALPYRDNEVVLHTDARLLPKNRSTWSSWNYLLSQEDRHAVVTYNMNILQGIEAPETFCVTLNKSDAIDPARILGRFNYSHPVFTPRGLRAQRRWKDINGGRTWYCGAYWYNGFHEDGVNSAMRVAEHIRRQCRPPARLVSAA